MTNNNQNERRNFLKKATVGGLVALTTPQILLASSEQKEPLSGNPLSTDEAESAAKAGKIVLSDNDVILFQGDSITDAGRKRNLEEANNNLALGVGYAFLASSILMSKYPGKNLKIYNRGVSGDKVYQLAERWDKDCLDLKPTVLSLLIGVNDYWFKHAGKYDATVKVYEDDYRKLLDRTLKQFPNVKLILGQPFAVKGVKAVDETWYPEFYAYQEAAQKIAKEYKAVWIPYQSVFDTAGKTASGAYWTKDGVHPSVAGAQLMANAWLDTIK